MAQSLAEEKNERTEGLDRHWQLTCPLFMHWARIAMLVSMHSLSPADRMHTRGKNEEGELQSQAEADFVRAERNAIIQSFSGKYVGDLTLYTLHLCVVFMSTEVKPRQ